MDLRFITALVVFAGLFGLAFVILGVLQRSSSNDLVKGGTGMTRILTNSRPVNKGLAPLFPPVCPPGCSPIIPGQDLHGQCFSSLGFFP